MFLVVVSFKKALWAELEGENIHPGTQTETIFFGPVVIGLHCLDLAELLPGCKVFS